MTHHYQVAYRTDQGAWYFMADRFPSMRRARLMMLTLCDEGMDAAVYERGELVEYEAGDVPRGK
jgi:hypothetical protein